MAMWFANYLHVSAHILNVSLLVIYKKLAYQLMHSEYTNTHNQKVRDLNRKTKNIPVVSQQDINVCSNGLLDDFEHQCL
jgi:hypothetical protein